MKTTEHPVSRHSLCRASHLVGAGVGLRVGVRVRVQVGVRVRVRGRGRVSAGVRVRVRVRVRARVRVRVGVRCAASHRDAFRQPAPTGKPKRVPSVGPPKLALQPAASAAPVSATS